MKLIYAEYYVNYLTKRKFINSYWSVIKKKLEHYFKNVMNEENFYKLFGKMTLYFNQASIKHLDIDQLLLNVYDLLMKITDTIYPKPCKQKENILTYLEADSINTTIFIKNYILSEEKEKQYKKCK